MPSHQDRIRRHYVDALEPPQQEIPVAADPSLVTTAVINSYEKDVRALLDYIETQYVTDGLRGAMQRLRRVVGYRV